MSVSRLVVISASAPGALEILEVVGAVDVGEQISGVQDMPTQAENSVSIADHADSKNDKQKMDVSKNINQ